MKLTAIIAAGACLLAEANASPLARRVPDSAEPLSGVETRFSDLVTGEGRFRIISTRPAGAKSPLPAVHFVQWLSCDTIEITNTNDGWTQMLRSLVLDSGMVVQRMDKSGVGDSEGVPCSELDYESELAHHRAALEKLLSDPWVDRRRVFIFGASMGANMAPLLAQGFDIKGVAVWGGGAQSWFERQLGFERRNLELGRKSAREIDERMRRLSKAYSAILLDGLSVEELARRDKNAASDWSLASGADEKTQFGRPIAFHQQAQRRHWADAWAQLKAPVLALYGAFDWYETRDGVELIGTVANASRPRNATVTIVPGLDHHFTRFASTKDAYDGVDGRPDPQEAMMILLPWLKETAR